MSNENRPKIMDPDKKYTLPEPRTHTEALQRQLIRLAASWLRTQDLSLVIQYRNAFQELKNLGWDGALDISTELLDQRMRESYPDIFGSDSNL